MIWWRSGGYRAGGPNWFAKRRAYAKHYGNPEAYVIGGKILNLSKLGIDASKIEGYGKRHKWPEYLMEWRDPDMHDWAQRHWMDLEDRGYDGVVVSQWNEDFGSGQETTLLYWGNRIKEKGGSKRNPMTDRVTLTETYKTGKGAGVIVAQSGKVRGPYTITVLVGDKRKGYGAPKSRKVAKLGDARAALRGKLGPLRKASNPNEVIRLVLGEEEGATVSETVNPQSQLSKRVALGKRQILADIRKGDVPDSVSSFSDLHDYVDANYYGGAFDDSAPSPDDPIWDRVQDQLDKWIRAGGHRGGRRNPIEANPINKYYFQRGDGGLIMRKQRADRRGTRGPSKPLWVGSLEAARDKARELHKASRGRVKITILRVEPDGDQRSVGSVGNPSGPRYKAVGKPYTMKGFYGVLDTETGNLVRTMRTKAVAQQAADSMNREDYEDRWRRGFAGPGGPPRRNPNGNGNMADADRLYEDFHGRPPTQTTRVVTRTKARTDLAELGPLTELKVHLLTGKRIKLPYEVDCDDQVMLCSSPDGRQLYFVGGDQYIDLLRLGMSGPKWEKDSMVLGVLEMVTYRTEKGFDKFKLTDYYHELGEESGMQPLLMYDNINGLLSVAGGQYEVRPEGIVN